MDSEANLIKRLRGNDQAAFSAIFDKYRRGIMAYAEQITRDRASAEDVVQETFLELVRRIDGIDPDKGVSGWLYRVARNRAIDVVRRGGREMPVEEVPEGPRQRDSAAAGLPDEAIQGREAAKELQAALGRVDGRLREVLVMHYLGGLAFREIAAALRRPLGTVLWQARRGLESLKEIMRNNGE